MKLTPPPKSPLLVTIVQLGLLLLFIYATFIGGQTAQGIFDHRWRLITLWLTAGLGGGWLLWKLVRGQSLPRTPLDGPLLFLTAAWLLATIFSLNPVYSREAFVFFTIYLLFFYIAVEVGRWPWLAELTLNAIIGVSGMVWMLALVQLSRWYQDQVALGLAVTSLPPRLSVLGNPNTMASYIGLVLPLILYKLITGQGRLVRGLLGVWLVTLTGAILLTGSRGGLLGLAVAGLFFGLGWVRRQSPAAMTTPVFGRGRWLVTFILVGVGVGLVGLALLSRGLQSGVSVRQQVMSGALKTIAAHPLLGAGPGALGEALLRYQQPLDVIWSDAHNIILTLVAETGLVGGLGLVWLGWVSFKLLWSSWRGEPAAWPLSSLSCAAALLGFLAHNQVDSLFKYPLIMLHVAILAGFWLSPTVVMGPASPTRARLRVVAAGLALLVALFSGVQGVQNIKAYNESVTAANRDDWALALAKLEEAERLAPAMPFYQRQEGLLAGYLAAGDPVYRPQAIAAYEAALRQVDHLAVDQANLACLFWADDQPEAALRTMARAVELAPGESLYHLNWGYYLEQTGQIAAAEAAYAEVLRLRPAAAQAHFWTETPDRAVIWPAILNQTRQRLAEMEPAGRLSLARLYFYVGEYEAAGQLYDQLLAEGADSAQLRLERGRVLLALGDTVEAERELRQALTADPSLSDAYLALSKMSLADGDMPAARRASDIALTLAESGETLFQAGQVAEARGELTTALATYEAAFERAVNPAPAEPDRYATEVARRRPLPLTYLPCLIQLYPGPLLTEITQAQARLLEQQGQPDRAAELYDRLQRYGPAPASQP